MVGKTISHYRILSTLGKGATGVIYRAEDTRLGRTVAMKFVPEALVTNRVAVERFKREARAVSALNHPSICTLHDVDEWEGQPFLVMECLEGGTLKERVTGKQLTLEELLELDDTLAEAHTSLAWARFHNWDWAGAEQEFKRAIELNPSYPMARSWYGEYLKVLV